MKDWMIRALKTFVQAFGGVVVPELVMILSDTLPGDWAAWKLVLAPILCAGLAAGISAAWNITLEALKKEGAE